MFAVKQIVWAKTKSYPWWPAQINKLPCSDQNFFKVTFVGQTNHAHLEEKAVKKYLDNYEAFSKISYKGLQNSIRIADNEIQKRKTHMIELQNKGKASKSGAQKGKKIKKKSKNKLKSKKNFLQQIKPLNDHLKTLQADNPQKIEKKLSEQCSVVKMSNAKEGQAKSQNESVDLSDEVSEIQFDELDYLTVDRKRIENAEEKLFIIITQLNSGAFDLQRECLEVVYKIEKEEFKPEQLLQSKITNMITYIHKKLKERASGELKKDQISKMIQINDKLKTKVLDYLFNCSYYDQFLKHMDKNVSPTGNTVQKQEKSKSQPRTFMKKGRKYKRRPISSRRSGQQILK